MVHLHPAPPNKEPGPFQSSKNSYIKLSFKEHGQIEVSFFMHKIGLEMCTCVYFYCLLIRWKSVLYNIPGFTIFLQLNFSNRLSLISRKMKFRFQWEQEAGGCGHKENPEAGNMLSHAIRPLVNFSVVWLRRQSIMQWNVKLSWYLIAHQP